VSIEQSIDIASEEKYDKKDLPSDINLRYVDYPDPIKSHKVDFKINNISGLLYKNHL